jgi:protein SCO1/2
MCVFEPIEWQASVLLGKDGKHQSVPFVFNIDPAVPPTNSPRLELATPPSGGTAFLRGADGAYSAQYLGGYAAVLFFGYTAAPPGCPQPFTIIDNALAKLSPEERAKVRVVMVALDPAGDAPERLQRELQTRHLPNYRVVTGAGADLIGVARLHGAAFVPQPPGSDGKPRIDHSVIYSLLDTNGRLVRQVTAQDPERLASEVRKVLAIGAAAPSPEAQ